MNTKFECHISFTPCNVPIQLFMNKYSQGYTYKGIVWRDAHFLNFTKTNTCDNQVMVSASNLFSNISEALQYFVSAREYFDTISPVARMKIETNAVAKHLCQYYECHFKIKNSTQVSIGKDGTVYIEDKKLKVAYSENWKTQKIKSKWVSVRNTDRNDLIANYKLLDESLKDHIIEREIESVVYDDNFEFDKEWAQL